MISHELVRYIGNAAEHGEWAVVFAKLLVAGKDEGPHAVLVRIRENGQPCPGVTLTDNGVKSGLNGMHHLRHIIGWVQYSKIIIVKHKYRNNKTSIDIVLLHTIDYDV